MARTMPYDLRKAHRIVEAVATGATLRSICNGRQGMPNLSQVYKWMKEHPEFLKTLKEADEFSARMAEEEAIDVARSGLALPDTAKTGAIRALTEQLRWSAERRDPAKYGQSAKVSIRVPVQIVTSLNLGQEGAVDSSDEASVYNVEAHEVVDVPFEEVPALPPPPRTRKRVLTPRVPPEQRTNPFIGLAPRRPKPKETENASKQQVSGRESGSVQASQVDEGQAATEDERHGG